MEFKEAKGFGEVVSDGDSFVHAADSVFVWAEDRGIDSQSSSPLVQISKLREEVGELEEALRDGTEKEAKLELGDCVVVLLIIAKLAGLDVVDCLEQTVKKISKRKGKMVNGHFVKD